MTSTATTGSTTAVTTETPTTVTRGTVLIVLASVCFGTSGPLVKPTMDAGLSPQQVVSFRIGLAAALLLAFVAATRPKLLRVRRSDVPLLLGYGLVGVALVQFLYFAAVSRIPIGVAMLLEFTSPVLVALWVRFVRRVILPARMWVGTTLALVGLAMVAEVWQGLRLCARPRTSSSANAGSARCPRWASSRGAWSSARSRSR
jgi:drug/metabolite transporter (DMT)-like permease